MKKKSAGLLPYRFSNGELELLLGHMGGPFWEKKDEGAWTIMKGEYPDGEDPFAAAKREFFEETGLEARGSFTQLKTLKQSSGKLVSAWAFEGDCDASKLHSNTFTLEWPPHSGAFSSFPEIDRAEWFPVSTARRKIVKGQRGFVEELCGILRYDLSEQETGNS